jgi:hypothetical protein
MFNQMKFFKKWKEKQEELPKWFDICTFLILSPIMYWPYMMAMSILFFDSESASLLKAFHLIIFYPLVLIFLFFICRAIYFFQKAIAKLFLGIGV